MSFRSPSRIVLGYEAVRALHIADIVDFELAVRQGRLDRAEPGVADDQRTPWLIDAAAEDDGVHLDGVRRGRGHRDARRTANRGNGSGGRLGNQFRQLSERIRRAGLSHCNRELAANFQRWRERSERAVPTFCV